MTAKSYSHGQTSRNFGPASRLRAQTVTPITDPSYCHMLAAINHSARQLQPAIIQSSTWPNQQNTHNHTSYTT